VSTKYGGHIAFCEGLLPTGCNYSCRMFREYLEIILNDEKNELVIPKSSRKIDISDKIIEENEPIQSTPVFTL